MIEKTGDMLANTVRIKDPHCLDTFNYAPIHYAAIMGNVKCTEILLQYSSPVDITTSTGLTPLHLAVKYPDVVKLLLKHKANPKSQTFDKLETVLHKAAIDGCTISVSKI